MKTFIKNISYPMLAATIALCAASCQNESLTDISDSNALSEIKISTFIKSPHSRVTTGEDYKTTFVANDKIGVFVNEVISYTNLQYTTSDGTTWTGPTMVIPADGTYTYYAYYPYYDYAYSSNLIAKVSNDQDVDGFEASDFLYSKIVGEQGATNVSFWFEHAHSMLDITLTGDKVNENTEVTLSGINTQSLIDMNNTPDISIVSSTPGSIKMKNMGEKKYRAIIPSQEIISGTQFIEVKINFNTYKISYDQNINLTSGERYEITVDLSTI